MEKLCKSILATLERVIEYILHHDGTGEPGSEIVFMVKDKYNVQTRTKNSMLELNTNELLVTVLLLKIL